MEEVVSKRHGRYGGCTRMTERNVAGIHAPATLKSRRNEELSGWKNLILVSYNL